MDTLSKKDLEVCEQAVTRLLIDMIKEINESIAFVKDVKSDIEDARETLKAIDMVKSRKEEVRKTLDHVQDLLKKFR